MDRKIKSARRVACDLTDSPQAAAAALHVIQADRHYTAEVLVDVSAALLSGKHDEASRMLTDAIVELRWGAK